eukprot:5165592-Alexandrium_andersonii.AAC.2
MHLRGCAAMLLPRCPAPMGRWLRSFLGCAPKAPAWAPVALLRAMLASLLRLVSARWPPFDDSPSSDSHSL